MKDNGEIAADRNDIKINGIHKHFQPQNDINACADKKPHSENAKCTRDKKDADISQCPFFRSVISNNAEKSINTESKNEILSQFSGELATSLIKDIDNLRSNEDNEEKLNFQELEIGKCSSIASLSSRNSDVETNSQINELTLKDGLTVVAEYLGITYVKYKDETQMPEIMRLITKDLSEPYSIYTYRYFIHNWPQLCFLALSGSEYVGAIVCKLDVHKKVTRRGYIAMLAVDKTVRRKRIGTTLVKTAIEAMDKDVCDEVVLETEVSNKPALQLYENLGFVRDKRLFRYYLNGVDALRLKLWLR